ncbi:MAG: helix-turn-helix domain-containing protein [Acidimicrobiia bacterium]
MDVALIQWPSDDSLREELARQGRPRLLLVEPDAEAPVCVDVLEDWVRLPVSRADRNARIRALETRSGQRDRDVPVLSRDGTVEFRGDSTQLSEIQARVVAPMIDRFGGVVSRETLAGQAWPGAPSTGNNLDVTVARLRRQVGPLGLMIKTVRSRGYLLCDVESGRPDPSPGSA